MYICWVLLLLYCRLDADHTCHILHPGPFRSYAVLQYSLTQDFYLAALDCSNAYFGPCFQTLTNRPAVHRDEHTHLQPCLPAHQGSCLCVSSRQDVELVEMSILGLQGLISKFGASSPEVEAAKQVVFVALTWGMQSLDQAFSGDLTFQVSASDIRVTSESPIPVRVAKTLPRLRL